MTSASEQTSASKRDERYITAPSGKRITESEWMNGGDPEWTDEFKQKTFDNFHRQEFTSPQQQPDTMPEGWIEVDGKVYVPVEEASQLAANQCLHGIHGDDWGNPYCPKIKDQDKRIADLEAEIARLKDQPDRTKYIDNLSRNYGKA